MMVRGRRHGSGRSWRAPLLITFGLPLLLLASCADEGGPISVQRAGTRCSSDAECSFYLTCREEQCRFRCASDADCHRIGNYTCQEKACMHAVANE